MADDWFVVNVADAEWQSNEKFGAATGFETRDARFPELGYPRSELALRHGAGVETATTSPREAYAPFPPWRLGPPDTSRRS